MSVQFYDDINSVELPNPVLLDEDNLVRDVKVHISRRGTVHSVLGPSISLLKDKNVIISVLEFSKLTLNQIVLMSGFLAYNKPCKYLDEYGDLWSCIFIQDDLALTTSERSQFFVREEKVDDLGYDLQVTIKRWQE